MNHVEIFDTAVSFLAGLMKSVPPLSELFEQAGMALPEYLAKKKEETPEAPVEPEE